MGVRCATLKWLGILSDLRDRLTFSEGGDQIWRLRQGLGLRAHDLIGESLISLRTSKRVMGSKADIE